MGEDMYPAATPEIAAHRKDLAPEINEAFEKFSRAVFAEGALQEKTNQLIAVAVAHVTQCPYCIAHRLASPRARACVLWKRGRPERRSRQRRRRFPDAGRKIPTAISHVHGTRPRRMRSAGP
jgi:hypothetical protein